MQGGNYSFLSKLLHKIYLGNYFVSRTSFDLEQTIYQNKIENTELKEIVFVTGLARSGTTALFNAIYATNEFASLKYSNMPFLLMPNLWSKLSKSNATGFVERAHNDGIKVNSESPEEFDEYFWKVFLNDNYIKEKFLAINHIKEDVSREYEKYIKSICNASNKKNYLSKNNNNVLRINSLLTNFPAATIVVLYREPLEHAKSLLNQHINFSYLHSQDPFSLDYFNYLGHHEFGLNHKPFHFGGAELTGEEILGVDYWLTIWINYYQYILEIFEERLILISFEDLCQNPKAISKLLNDRIQSGKPIQISENYAPHPHKEINFDRNLKEQCDEVYKLLNEKRK